MSGHQEAPDAAEARLDALAAGLADPDGDVGDLYDEQQALAAVWEPRLVPRLEEHLTSAVEAGNWYARCVLADLLAEIAGRAALPSLLRAFSRDLGDDQDSLSTTLLVLAQEDPSGARQLLVPWVDHPDPELRRAAIWLLGFVLDPVDLPMLTRAAADPDERIRSVTVGTLSSLDTPETMQLLVELLGDPSEQVKVSVLSSLGFRRRAETLPHLRALADDRSPRVRAWVAIALARFPQADRNDPATAGVLGRLAHDRDPYVREQAAAALS